MTPAVALLRDLIQIPSVNPDGDPGVETTGEAECAAFLAEKLRALGAEVSLRDVLPGRPNVVARFPSATPGKPRLLLAPHTDTVSVGGMTINPFGGEVREDKVWGRGASDTKGPMAAMLTALANCRDILPHGSHEIWFAGLMGEEAGQHGAKALASKETFDFVIVGEPTSLDVVHTHKGSAWITLRTHGVAAHGSQPENGSNAIDAIIPVLLRLHSDLDLNRWTHPVLGRSTLNIGTIRGGTKINVVPDHCEVGIDLRTVPGQPVDEILHLIGSFLPTLAIQATESAPLWTDPNHPLIRQLQNCGATPVGAPWFCDAAIFARHGTPAVALGPGSIAQAHTANEWISIKDLENGVAFFETFLRSL